MNAEGTNKAALLLMTVGEDEAAEAFRFLAPPEVRRITASVIDNVRSYDVVDVMRRIATLDGIQPATLRELDDVMTELLSGSDNVKRISHKRDHR